MTGLRDMMEDGGSYKRRLDVGIYRIGQSYQGGVKQMLNGIATLVLSVYGRGNVPAAVMKTKALIQHFSKVQATLFEHAGAAVMAQAHASFHEIEHALELVCESLCT